MWRVDNPIINTSHLRLGKREIFPMDSFAPANLQPKRLDLIDEIYSGIYMYLCVVKIVDFFFAFN